MVHRRRSVAIVLVVLAVLATFGPSVSVNAGIKKAGIFSYVSETQSFTDSPDEVTALCPAGTRATGAGGSVKRPSVDTLARLTEIVPFDAGDGDSDEDDGARIRATWTDPASADVRAVAVCMKDDASLLTYARDEQAVTFSTQEFVFCATPEEAVGGGGGFPSDEGSFEDTGPWPGDAGWQVLGGLLSGATLAVVAACLPDATRRIELVEKSGNVPGESSKKLVARCPRGTRVSAGGGGSAEGGPFITSSLPWDGPDPDRVPDDGWAVTLVRAFPGGDAEVRAQAVCVGRALS